jgi:imidazolonepropionase-like amidohydrolase
MYRPIDLWDSICPMRALIGSLGLAVLLAPAAAQPPPTTVFDGARLITGDGRSLENGTLVVENGRISAIGPRASVTVPRGAVRVDLTGRTVMPALVNAHVHLGYQRGATFAADSYTRDTIVDQLNRYAVAGVAAVLSLGTDPGALPLELRAEQRDGRLGGALFRMAGRGLAPPGAGPANAAMRPSAHGITTEAEARAAVREEAARGADVIKVWVDDRNGTVAKLTIALARAIIDEAHARKLRTIAHIFYLDDAKELARAGIDAFAHLPRDREADDELVALMRERRVTIVPNMSISENGTYAAPPEWLGDPLFERLTTADERGRIRASFASRTPEAAERATRTYRGMERSVAKMNAAGVGIAFGTDAGAVRDHVHAFTDHRELHNMVRAGLTPMQAIVAATNTSAGLVGLADHGTLAPGQSASFIVLDANPLDDIRHTRRIRDVYLRGQRTQR